ncbi:MAG: PhoH family protein [Acidobacteria bacterium]|nr:PhoH family protein [Acidobacteriota bacterium]MBV9476141.1 PhoH family protein [Acidobacteriota bacterium]
MADQKTTIELTLDEQQTHTLFGNHDENLRAIEDAFSVKISSRGSEIFVSGAAENIAPVQKILGELQQLVEQGYPMKKSDVSTGVRVVRDVPDTNLVEFFTDNAVQQSIRRIVTPRNMAQKMYLQAIQDEDVVFGVGPAGTGKTYLAVAAAAAALQDKQIKRIILCRPAVEAGERLGFLPGDIAEKVNPYLRPLYDSLYDIIGFEKVEKLMERSIIEIAPLAFMRGRTLNDSFIILDEAQNTTPEQMKMFLTRLGFGSKAVVTGDITQVDLPEGKKSGLREVRRILDGLEGLRFFDFSDRDVVRHPLVGRIVVAYDRADKEREKQQGTGTAS